VLQVAPIHLHHNMAQENINKTSAEDIVIRIGRYNYYIIYFIGNIDFSIYYRGCSDYQLYGNNNDKNNF